MGKLIVQVKESPNRRDSARGEAFSAAVYECLTSTYFYYYQIIKVAMSTVTAILCNDSTFFQ